MIVCICHNIDENTIKKEIESLSSSIDVVIFYNKIQEKMGCLTCMPLIESLIRKYLIDPNIFPSCLD